MAEYVRRKRPPATHPYWARLHDRTHPPSGKWAMLGLGLLGLLIGLVSGGRAAWTLYDAAKVASDVGVWVAAIRAVFVAVFELRGMNVRRPWRSFGRAVFAAGYDAVWTYVAVFVALTSLIVLFYWPMSGMGVLYGGLIGAACWAGFAFLVAWTEYRHWRQRQANWPKWEEMGRGHRRRFLVGMAPPSPPTTNDQ